MKSELINERLFEQLEAEGREIVYNKRNGKKIRARIIDPVKKLFEKGYISFEESASADKYSIDFEMSKQDNFAQAVLNGLPAGTSEFCFEDKRSQASRRVNDVKMLVRHLSTHRQRKLRKILNRLTDSDKLTSYELTLRYIFEARLSINRTEEAIKIHRDRIKTKCQEIAKIIFNYYEN